MLQKVKALIKAVHVPKAEFWSGFSSDFACAGIKYPGRKDSEGGKGHLQCLRKP